MSAASCRKCGCTDDRACPGGCFWVEPDLCASCAVPGYWMHETSGMLAPAVHAYLSGRPLSIFHIAALRAYFRQWAGAALWDKNPFADAADKIALASLRASIDGLTTRAALAVWLEAAAALGIDPL